MTIQTMVPPTPVVLAMDESPFTGPPKSPRLCRPFFDTCIAAIRQKTMKPTKVMGPAAKVRYQEASTRSPKLPKESESMVDGPAPEDPFTNYKPRAKPTSFLKKCLTGRIKTRKAYKTILADAGNKGKGRKEYPVMSPRKTRSGKLLWNKVFPEMA